MPSKYIHEIRDPIHVFVRLDSDERRVLDSRPFQRLRNIQQLALACLVYPGATHKRFEHSIGVMELATKAFDVVTSSEAIGEGIRGLVPELSQPDALRYWRRVLRMAALCHDIGHLPFSHAAEGELLPEGWTHERLTVQLVRSPEMEEIWRSVTPPLRSDDIAKIAVGKKVFTETTFTTWEALLSELVVGDAFGVDRMDYLLRDCHHAGVAYGRFDHFRLIDTLRILRPLDSEEPSLGLEHGGLHSAEALLLARYFMFEQVYMHPIRRVYDLHLIEFLQPWLPGGQFPVDVVGHLSYTDVDVLYGIQQVGRDIGHPAYEAAKRILERAHYKVAYSLSSSDLDIHPQPGQVLYGALCERFGPENVRHDAYHKTSGRVFDFPVLSQNNEVVSAVAESRTLAAIPQSAIDYVYVHPRHRDEAQRWLAQEKPNLLKNAPIEEEEE
ncbi:MAG: HD domain-containing protein [Chloroflexi bacterium]|nr:HD domain-containing protein [Chloroflexota bacterium]